MWLDLVDVARSLDTHKIYRNYRSDFMIVDFLCVLFDKDGAVMVSLV